MISSLMNPLTEDLEAVLERTRPLWEELRNQRLFITGGTGFFGSWLMESLARANQQMGLNASACVLTRHPAAFLRRWPTLAEDPAIRLHAGSVADFNFPAGEFSHIIHAATENDAGAGGLDPVAHFEANVLGTRRVLEFAGRCGARRLLFTSSGAIYGGQPPELELLPEDHPGAPSPLDTTTAYGQSKRVSEFLCRAFGEKHEVAVTIARPFALVGPFLKLDANFAVGNFIRDALRGGPIRVQGDGTPLRSYLYAADLAVWLWTILFRGRTGQAYNVGSDQAVSIGELAGRVADVLAPGTGVVFAGKAQTGRKPSRYVPAIGKAREELQLEVWMNLDEAIRRTAEWNQNLTT